MSDLANDILEKPTPYKWALEAGAAAVFGAAYRASKYLSSRENEFKYEKELTSAGAGAAAEAMDHLREYAGRSELFGYDDIAVITLGAYAGQQFTDRKLADYIPRLLEPAQDDQ